MATPTPAQLSEAHSAARARFTDQAVRYAVAQTEQFDAWYDSAAIAAFSARVAAQVQARQRLTAANTDAYLARVLSLLLRRDVRQAGVVDITGLRVGVTPAGVYGRVADTYRYRLSLDNSPEEALKLAVERARVAAELDVTLAFRAQVQATLTDAARRQGLVPLPRPAPDEGVAIGDVDNPETVAADAGPVLGYRRIVHPELSKGGSCGLCLAASTRTYSFAELLPVHARCACTVMVITAEQDPGLELNDADYKLLYGDAGGTSGRLLKRGRYRVVDNGETGPTLVRADDDVRTSAQAAAESTHGGGA